jgi:hypothetical protein
VRFLLVDRSGPAGNAPEHGGPIAPELLRAIADALDVQLNAHLSPHWGGNYVVRAAAGPDTIALPREVVCAIVDELPDAPGAVAYHDVNGTEVPVVWLARTACNSLTSGADSVSSALSHELLEAAGDPFVNAWRDDGRGAEWAQELCDAVQESGYTQAGIAVSNFVLPAFFAPGAAGPYDYLGTLGRPAVFAPLETAGGGYQIRRTGAGGEVSVFGAMAQRRRARKAHFSSRTSKRGARV